MKKTIAVALLLFTVLILVSWQQTTPDSNIAHPQFRTWLIKELEAAAGQLSNGLDTSVNLNQLQEFYFTARKHYKHTELYVEYCSPKEAKYYINGALVLKHEPDLGNEMLQPKGFQRIEELLFREQNVTDRTVLKNEYDLLIRQINQLITYYKTITISDGQLLEMCQLHLLRIASLNLNGYDATITQNNTGEIQWSLEGMEHVLKSFSTYTAAKKENKIIYQTLLQQCHSAIKFLKTNKDYNTFPRLLFITQFINPINERLVDFHNACRLAWDTRKQAINLKTYFLFGEKSFNLQYFSIYYDDTLLLQEQAELGKLLFFDNGLSANNNRSCSSCHVPSKAFTDGLAKNTSLDGNENILRNTPGLLNVIYQKAFFYDGNAYQLEQQIADVIHSKKEMGNDLNEIVKVLSSNPRYLQLFKQAFKGTVDTSITPYAIQKVIAEYEKKLISFNSRFDAYLKGDKNSLNQREVNGYNLFAGKGLCGSCHFFPLFNGTVPPFYTDSEFEIIGVPEKKDNKHIDSDVGRYAVTGIKEQMFSFKTPGLRNIALTAPYMHNCVYETLEETIDFYHRGGGKGWGFEVPNQTLPFDSLKLSKAEEQDIILFLRSLTDTSGVGASF